MKSHQKSTDDLIREQVRKALPNLTPEQQESEIKKAKQMIAGGGDLSECEFLKQNNMDTDNLGDVHLTSKQRKRLESKKRELAKSNNIKDRLRQKLALRKKAPSEEQTIMKDLGMTGNVYIRARQDISNDERKYHIIDINRQKSCTNPSFGSILNPARSGKIEVDEVVHNIKSKFTYVNLRAFVASHIIPDNQDGDAFGDNWSKISSGGGFKKEWFDNSSLYLNGTIVDAKTFQNELYTKVLKDYMTRTGVTSSLRKIIENSDNIILTGDGVITVEDGKNTLTDTHNIFVSTILKVILQS